MAQELTNSNYTPTLDEQAEQTTMAAVTAAIRSGFDPTNTGNPISIRQVVDTCAIIVTFLKEAEKTPRSVTEWRTAVENLTLNAKRQKT